MSRIKKIIDETAKNYNMPKEAILSRARRDIAITAARAKIIYELRNSEKPPSYPQLGKILNLDHTSCLYLHKKMAATKGRYYDDRLEKICRSTQLVHARRNRQIKLLKLKKAFEKGIVFQTEIP
jgi:chromosomal replication initiation ATPase DnaA